MTESVIPLPEEMSSFWAALTPAQRIAAQLVVILNAAADPSFKSRYRRRWWVLLEERVRLGALTSASLTGWSSSLSSSLGGSLGRNAGHRRAWERLVATDVPRAEVLDALDRDAAIAIAFTRALSEHNRAITTKLNESEA